MAVFAADAAEGNFLFITAQGMLKKTARAEYILTKTVFQAIRLNEGDRVIAVQLVTEADGTTIFFVTKGGMCLNARNDDIPAQGRVAGGVKGMNLAEGDEVLYASQIDGEGEILVGITGGRVKRIIAAQVDSLPRYRKGVRIAALREGEKVIFADYVTKPYMLGIISSEGTMSEVSTEDISIDAMNTRGRPLKGGITASEIFALKSRPAD